MTLNEWFEINQEVTKASFCRQLGVEWSTLWRWLAGRTIPSPKRILEIEHITGGAVTPADWYPSIQSKD